MNKKEYTVGYFTEPTDVDDYVEYDGRRIHPSEIVDILNEQKDKILELEKKNEKCKKLKKKRLRKIRHQRTAIDELGAAIMGYKYTIKKLKGDIND